MPGTVNLRESLSQQPILRKHFGPVVHLVSTVQGGIGGRLPSAFMMLCLTAGTPEEKRAKWGTSSFVGAQLMLVTLFSSITLANAG